MLTFMSHILTTGFLTFSEPPYMPIRLGKLKDLSKFDAEFFGFNQPHRVNVMEPMSRIIMEKAYEALVDSGKNFQYFPQNQGCQIYLFISEMLKRVLT